MEHFVLDGGAHPGHRPACFLTGDDVGRDAGFETAVLHVADVLVIAAEAQRDSHRVAHEHVLGVTVVVFQGEGQAVEETCLDTDVEVLVLFPLEFLAFQRGDDGTRVGTVRIAEAVEGLPCIETAEVIVTLHTIGCLEGQVVDPADAAHEILLGDTPGSTHRPEVTPAHILVETGGTVAAVGSRHIVFVSVIEVCAGEIRLDTVIVGIGVRILKRGGRCQFIQVAERIAALVTHQVLVVVGVGFVAGKQVDVEVAEVAVPGQQLVEGVAEGASVSDLSKTVHRFGIAEIRVVVGLGLGSDQVETEVHGQLEALEGALLEAAEFHEGTAAQVVGSVEIFVFLEVGQRVPAGRCTGGAVFTPVILLLAVGVEHVVAGSVTDVHRIDRRHQLACVEHVAVGRAGRLAAAEGGRVGGIVGETDVQTGTEPVYDLAFHVRTAGETLEIGILDKTFFIEVTDGEHVLVALVATRNRHLVFLAEGSLRRAEIQPVVVPFEADAVDDLARLMVEQLRSRDGEGVVFFIDAEYVVDAARNVGEGHLSGHQRLVTVCQIGVFHHAVEVFGPLICVQGFVSRDGAGSDTPVALEADTGSAFGAMLGRDDHHTVCTTRTVERAGRCVLDDGHRLDVVGVQGVDAAIVRHAVHHVERVGGSVQGAETTNTDSCAGTRLAGTGRRLDTGGHTVEGLGHIGDGPFLDLLGLDGLGGTRKGLFLRRTVGDYEHVLQEFGIRCEDDVDDRTAFNRHLLRLVADGAENERRTRRNRQEI